jgi:hypothetical protein
MGESPRAAHGSRTGRFRGADSLVDVPGAGQGREQVTGDPLGPVLLLAGVSPVQEEVTGTLVHPDLLRCREPGGE